MRLSFPLWGYEEFSGCKGRKYPTETFFGGDPVRKTAPCRCRFCFFWRPKENLLPFALKRATPCERLVSGSTPNKITSCLRASRSGFSLFRLRKGAVVFGDALNLLNRDILASDLIQRTRPVEGNIWMKSKEKPPSGGGAYTDVREHPRRGL